MAHKRRTVPGGTRGSVFKEVARIRREDASVLFEARRYRGAIYLAGYAVECLLKWAITERCEITYLPAELETHDWDTLLPEAGLANSLRTNHSLRAVYSELAELWGPELRYLSKEPSPREAERLYQQMEQVLPLGQRRDAMSATTNVNKVLRRIIPRGQRFRVTWEPAGFGKYQVLRVVTPAWKTRPRFERILKVQKAIDANLPPKVLERILRVSVLTANEYRRWLGTLVTSRPHRTVGRRRLANGK